MSLLSLFFPEFYEDKLEKIPKLLVILSPVGAVLLLTIWTIKTKESDKLAAFIIALGFFVLLFSIASGIIFKVLQIFTYNFMSVSFCAFVWAYALSIRFNREHKDLIDLKNNLEQKVLLRTLQLEEEQQAKTEIFINLAHENKTPLTLIANYLDKDIETRGASTDILIVKDNIIKLKRDMINYIDLEKLERGNMYYVHDQIVNLSHFINTKVLMFKEIANKKNINIKSDIKDSIYIKIDPSALDSILNNLLDNAVKYTNKGGKIDILLNIDKKNINIIIKDTGIGIPEDKYSDIFKPFQQIQQKKKNYQGIGMGLNIVNKIVENVNGKIEVKSNVDKGSSFKIILEKYDLMKNDKVVNIEMEKPETQIINIDLKEKEYDENRKSILIVEDNKQMLSYIKEKLEKKYNVFFALDGRKALERLNTIERLDLIISDIMMDNMDGYEFYDNIRADDKYKSIPFVFLTAKSDNKNKLIGLRKGAADFIKKPFIIEDIELKLNNLINLKDEQVKATYSNIVKERKNKFEKLLKENKISDIEKDIILYVNNGLFNKEIAHDLKIAEQTVKNYLSEIYKKMNVTGRTELIKLIQDYCN